MSTTPSTNRVNHRAEGITESEWEALTVTFGVDDMARLIRANKRFVQNHAEELGGYKVAGRWTFSKPKTAELLGL